MNKDYEWVNIKTNPSEFFSKDKSYTFDDIPFLIMDNLGQVDVAFWSVGKQIFEGNQRIEKKNISWWKPIDRNVGAA